MPAAFIVDGMTEKKIVQTLCPGAVVRMTNLNGKDVSLAAMAKAVHSFLNLFKGRHYPVIVIADREGRSISSEDLERCLMEELKKYPNMRDEIIVASPDRMIENWMLSDPVYFKEFFDVELERCFEGCNGKNELRQLLRSKNVAYHELTVGHQVFCNVSVRSLHENSESFARFHSRAMNYCKWLRF